MNRKTILSILGFAMFIVGGLALVLSLIGTNLTYMRWAENLGPMAAFIIKILMMILGIGMVFVALNPPDPEMQQ